MAIADAINKVTGGHGATIEESVKNLSSGGGSGALIVNARTIEGKVFPTLDKTWQEIYDAFSNNIPVFIKYVYNGGTDDFCIVIVSVAAVGLYEGSYRVHSSKFVDIDGPETTYIYTATQPNDYPTATMG